MNEEHETINPLNVEIVEKVMKDQKTFFVYKKTWMDFVVTSGISIENEPKEEDFAQYLELKRAGGLAGTTMKSIYSHLNKFYCQLYNKRLNVSKKS